MLEFPTTAGILSGIRELVNVLRTPPLPTSVSQHNPIRVETDRERLSSPLEYHILCVGLSNTTISSVLSSPKCALHKKGTLPGHAGVTVPFFARCLGHRFFLSDEAVLLGVCPPRSSLRDSPAGFLRVNGGWPSRWRVTVLRDGAKIPRPLWTSGLSIGACYLSRGGGFCLPEERGMCSMARTSGNGGRDGVRRR